MDGNRLNFIRRNQRTLRVKSYLRLAHPVKAPIIEAGTREFVTIILPSSFIGSLRVMQQYFQDTMSVVRDFGMTHLMQMDIELTSEKSIKTKPHRKSPRKINILKDEIKQLLDLGAIVISQSDLTSPLILVENPETHGQV
ncbi:helitron_like_N domain-containing protein [Trichonephila inaurata madagascariensis]|uniref:Helitron_like_N domain-containing protein n=1 Tax=Trichonephila inaurata madagascariensis TaxID=2747483 RepID=A0A8X6KJU8_9ARAC|nr:helitron_like_N domain-containing protein [Trichonephila inaurata madagascariensis]